MLKVNFFFYLCCKDQSFEKHVSKPDGDGKKPSDFRKQCDRVVWMLDLDLVILSSSPALTTRPQVYRAFHRINHFSIY